MHGDDDGSIAAAFGVMGLDPIRHDESGPPHDRHQVILRVGQTARLLSPLRLSCARNKRVCNDRASVPVNPPTIRALMARISRKVCWAIFRPAGVRYKLILRLSALLGSR